MVGSVRGRSQRKAGGRQHGRDRSGVRRRLQPHRIQGPLLRGLAWARHQYVSHRTYDHTSVIRFIESRFSLPALTRRDANADALFDFFDFSDKEAKLRGQQAGWGQEELPPSFPSRVRDLADPRTWHPIDVPAQSIQLYGSGVGPIPPNLFGMRATNECQSIFPASTFSLDKLGKNTYGDGDYSDGILPPTSYVLTTPERGIGEQNVRR